MLLHFYLELTTRSLLHCSSLGVFLIILLYGYHSEIHHFFCVYCLITKIDLELRLLNWLVTVWWDSDFSLLLRLLRKFHVNPKLALLSLVNLPFFLIRVKINFELA